MIISCCQGSIVRWTLEEVERNPLYGKKRIIEDCGLQDKEVLDIDLTDACFSSCSWLGGQGSPGQGQVDKEV